MCRVHRSYQILPPLTTTNIIPSLFLSSPSLLLTSLPPLQSMLSSCTIYVYYASPTCSCRSIFLCPSHCQIVFIQKNLFFVDNNDVVSLNQKIVYVRNHQGLSLITLIFLVNLSLSFSWFELNIFISWFS